MKELKNPVFWAFISLLSGMIVAAWGWDKYESTIAERTHGSITMIVVGVSMIVAGLLVFFIAGQRK